MTNENSSKQRVLDHYRNPRNYGVIEDADLVSKEAGPPCGDEVHFYLKLDRNRITDIRFTSSSCAICKASASMLSEMIKGKEGDYVMNLGEKDIMDMFGMDLEPNRRKCALLPLAAIKKGITNQRTQQKRAVSSDRT